MMLKQDLTFDKVVFFKDPLDTRLVMARAKVTTIYGNGKPIWMLETIDRQEPDEDAQILKEFFTDIMEALREARFFMEQAEALYPTEKGYEHKWLK